MGRVIPAEAGILSSLTGRFLPLCKRNHRKSVASHHISTTSIVSMIWHIINCSEYKELLSNMKGEMTFP